MALKDLNKARDFLKDTRDEYADVSDYKVVNNPNGDVSSDSLHNNIPFKQFKLDDVNDEILVRRAQVLGLGDPNNALSNSFYGINIKAHTAMVPNNQESMGVVFFTRPDLSLTDANCATERHFVSMLTDDENSYHASFRAYLDPDGQRNSAPTGTSPAGPYINSNLVDPLNPFISLLTNTCKTLTGWPDPIMDVSVSAPGRRGEVHGIADGVYKVFGQYDLTGTFKNIPFDPVRQLFDYWCMYQSNISIGRMFPNIKNIIAQRVDYYTRPYRLVLDKSRQIVTRIGAAGASHPLVTDIGRIFDYDAEKTLVEAPDVVMQFKCYGAIYNDPLLVVLFNELVSTYNPAMSTKQSRENSFVKLMPSEWSMFNYAAYPYINEESESGFRELEWWVLKENYDVINKFYAGIADSRETPAENLARVREDIRRNINKN